MISRTRVLFVTGIVSAAVAAASTFAFASTTADPRAAADEMPVAVEDFNYPGADRVLAEKGITLKRGDGHIILVDCGQTAEQIKVMTVKDDSVGRDGQYCFQATAKTGFLTLELPRVFALETGEHPISADLTANGETLTVDVPKDGFESVGEGDLNNGQRSVLVEIRVTG
ncbi:hypothetical protein [Streptomyces sp. rh34]|uniref:hypothetical protein n=1 Tax=Streptomyces sp. rh34 TaxID=2034272 RepID=UPI00211D47B2|nr:hypothetical protein [Streptomyces sp. rh34]